MIVVNREDVPMLLVPKLQLGHVRGTGLRFTD